MKWTTQDELAFLRGIGGWTSQRNLRDPKKHKVAALQGYIRSAPLREWKGPDVDVDQDRCLDLAQQLLRDTVRDA